MIRLLAFSFSGAGAFLGILGTLMMSKAYHPFSTFWGLLKHLLYMFWIFWRYGVDKGLESIKFSTEIGRINEEDRGYSFLGIGLIFLSFWLQLIGAILAFFL